MSSITNRLGTLREVKLDRDESAENDLSDGAAAYLREDYAEAVKLFLLAAQQGDASSQYNLGVMSSYYHPGWRTNVLPRDDVEAVRWYRLAAEQGHALAQHNLGLMYANGEGVPQDYVEVVRWYRLAAEQGLARAQNNLGVMYVKGEGVIAEREAINDRIDTCSLILRVPKGVKMGARSVILWPNSQLV